jgi:hypothetical protein
VISELQSTGQASASSSGGLAEAGAGAGSAALNASVSMTYNNIDPDCDFVLLLGPDGLEARPLSDIQEHLTMESDAS